MRYASVLLALLGCSQTVDFPIEFWVDPAFDDQSTCLAAEAVARWERATNAGLSHRVAWHPAYDHAIRFATESKGHLNAYGYTEGGVGGRVWLFADRMRAGSDNYSSTFLRVTLHELGHHMGLEHTASGVMFDGETTPCVAQIDVDQFCALYGCSRLAPMCEPPPAECR